MDNVTKGSKKTIGIMVVILAAIIISFRGYSLIQIFLSKDNYYYEPGELYLLYFEELLVIITLITVIIAVAKNHRKIAMFALAIQYAIAVALNIIESDNDNIKLLPIVCVIIISVTLFLCALKKINTTIAAVICFVAKAYSVILQVHTLIVFIKRWSFMVVWKDGFFFTFLVYIVYILAESAVLICLICMREKPKIVASANNSGKFTEAACFEQRNIALCIILSIVTLGIYGMFWLADIVKDVHKLHGDDNSVVAEVLSILFIPFYGWYWMYTRGKQMFEDSNVKGGNIADNGVIYLILSIFVLYIVDYALIQNEFNKYTTDNMKSIPKYINNQPNLEEPSDITSKLTELKGLLNSELITEAEYESKRKEILDRM